MYARSTKIVAALPGKTTALLASFIVLIAVAVAGCASAVTTCTVRHHFAIVIFQDGMGNPGPRYVTGFRLTVRYPGGAIARRQLFTRITLRAADGKNPPLIVKTYRVGRAETCAVGQVRAHR